MKFARSLSRFERLPLHTTVVAIALLWTLPTAGLLSSSFRRQDALLQTGWWTVFQHPFDLAQFHIGNYIDVLASQGMGQAFLNSLVIAIPATVIPISIATFAAYALDAVSRTPDAVCNGRRFAGGTVTDDPDSGAAGLQQSGSSR